MAGAERGDYGPIEVYVEPLGQTSRIEEEWRDLELRAAASVFLSWFWIETWTQKFTGQLVLVRMVHGDRTVALGVLAASCVPRWLFGDLRVIGLNEAPGTDLSKISVEYNGLLCEVGAERAVHLRFAEFICDNLSKHNSLLDWRECRLPGIDEDIKSIIQSNVSAYRVYRANAAPYVKLSTTLADFQNYLNTLGRNTRHQVRRSLRLYKEHGDITVKRPDSVETAHFCMERLIELHQSQWIARGKPGAFSFRVFREFHFELIDKFFHEGLTDLIEVKAGPKVIGILYNLRHAGVASSYQSGFSYSADNRLKPGLVCHALAVADYAASDLTTYRFLAGDQRYKQSLSNGSDSLYWVAIQKPDVRMRLENMLRELKAKF